ncbi:ankyrin repeat domain-containing protein [Pseudonocardia spinosispora]|uniref:ankyrin repeat domain-containing protein n=1 Tax=Pseudonocardia spinosispora TaxID=103441 RepID=UPI000419C1AE|nr:ankyrin repeat domain-containing protein [Pseudonocardia spinosispora]
MSTRPLPDSPSLEQLKKQAKDLQRAVRAAQPAELAAVHEFHPRANAVAASFTLSDAQLVLARQYRFASWSKLREHLDVVHRHSHWPNAADVPGSSRPGAADFLRLACLTYENDDDRTRVESARDLLRATPAIATEDIHTMAATGEVDAARELLARNPDLARAPGGPYGWKPLFHLAYSRVQSNRPGCSSVDMARLLLDHGADPNEGYLWRGLPSAFTVLTGVLGGGESDQPPHPDWLALAELLLDAGAEANDSQGLYNRQFNPDDSHLELLFRHGLGQGAGGPWRARLGAAYPSPAQMLADQLLWAARTDFGNRVELLLAHGVDPDAPGLWNDASSAYEVAALAGNRHIAELLAAKGATSALDDVQEFVAACMVADPPRVEGLLGRDPSLPARALAADPYAILRAAELGRRDAVVLLLSLGFDVNAYQRTTPLHEAARLGDLDLVRLLLARGADPTLTDSEFDATPLEWAEHFERDAVIELLSKAAPDPG